MKACATCEYFGHDGGESAEGVCRRSPPVVVVDQIEVTDDGDDGITHNYFYTTIFPAVTISEDCGNHNDGKPGVLIE